MNRRILQAISQNQVIQVIDATLNTPVLPPPAGPGQTPPVQDPQNQVPPDQVPDQVPPPDQDQDQDQDQVQDENLNPLDELRRLRTQYEVIRSDNDTIELEIERLLETNNMLDKEVREIRSFANEHVFARVAGREMGRSYFRDLDGQDMEAWMTTSEIVKGSGKRKQHYNRRFIRKRCKACHSNVEEQLCKLTSPHFVKTRIRFQEMMELDKERKPIFDPFKEIRERVEQNVAPIIDDNNEKVVESCDFSGQFPEELPSLIFF